MCSIGKHRKIKGAGVAKATISKQIFTKFKQRQASCYRFSTSYVNDWLRNQPIVSMAGLTCRREDFVF
jgi:hypothetical protein